MLDPFQKAEIQTYAEVIEEYLIGKKLDSGSFGDVFIAQKKKHVSGKVFEEFQAIKVMKMNNLLNKNIAKPIESMKREADILCNLDHPNIVKFYECFQTVDYFCIVIEYCDGGTLTEVLNNLTDEDTYLKDGTASEWMFCLLSALEYLHKNRIVHRDIKAHNVFLKKGLIKLGDFGEARFSLKSIRSQTLTRTVGTIHYMSPEMISGEKYTISTDIWSMGCLFYNIVYRELLHEGENAIEIENQIKNGDLKNLNDRPHEFTSLIKSMLMTDWTKRPAPSQLMKNSIFDKFVEKNKSIDRKTDKETDEINKRFDNKIKILQESTKSESRIEAVFDRRHYESVMQQRARLSLVRRRPEVPILYPEFNQGRVPNAPPSEDPEICTIA